MDYNYVVVYFSIGVALNFLYDSIISRIRREDLRFTNRERIYLLLLWPLFATMWITNLLKK